MLSPKQVSFLAHSDAFLNISDGAVRSGKTHSALRRFAEMCIEGPPGDFAVFGKTERTVKRNVVNPLKQMLPKGTVRYVQGAGELYVFDRLCSVIGANDVGAADKVQGATLAGSYCNELTLYPENMWQTIIDRHSVDGAKILGDCNPDSPYHWLNRDFLAADKPKDFLKRWRFKLDDNPVLSEAYKRNLELAHPPGTLWHKRMVLGEWVVAEGAIFPQFNEEDHVVSELPGSPEKIVVGVDYGTSTVTAFVMLGLIRGDWHVMKEYYYDARATNRQKSNGEYAKDFLDFVGAVRPQSTEIDPSASGFKVELRQHGVRRLNDADNTVVEGIRDIDKALTAGTLKVHKSCENLIQEFSLYSWDQKAQERGEDKPVKRSDHALDALRYACRRAFGSLPRRSLRVVR